MCAKTTMGYNCQHRKDECGPALPKGWKPGAKGGR